MKNEYPNRKVGLVTFNNEVTIIGDGTQEPDIIRGDKLMNYELLLEHSKGLSSTYLGKNIAQTHQKLGKKLYELEETGPTALGPGLIAAVGLAAEAGQGSQVVICTDGLANIGIGSLEDKKDNKDGVCEVEEFYKKIAQYAKSKGVTVNIITIKGGDESDLETLQHVYVETGGNVNVVEPEEITKNFTNIFENPVIATNVTVKVKLHAGMEFRNEPLNNLSENNTLLTRGLGNVNEESEITFEYRMKDAKVLAEMPEIDLLTIKEIPFQTQIEYTKLNGMKCI